jgi:hypothetical protein
MRSRSWLKTPGSSVLLIVFALATLSCTAPPNSSALRAAISPVGASTTPAAPEVSPVISLLPTPTPAPTVAATPLPPPAAAARTATPVPTAQPTPNLCGAPKNPFGYNFCKGGSLIYSPLPGFCSYFSCVSNFSSGTGAVVRCIDGMYSRTGGNPQACLPGHVGAGPFLKQP